jgi:antitoxin FitA
MRFLRPDVSDRRRFCDVDPTTTHARSTTRRADATYEGWPARLRRLPTRQAGASIASIRGDRHVAQLMVRNVDEAVVRELKRRAARRNHSAEQEHREILEQALLHPRRRSLAEVLAAMPDVGEDADFERRQTDRRA